MKKAFKKSLPIFLFLSFCIAAATLLLFLTGRSVQAAGLVDNTVDSSHLYSKYPLENYQLDFYVDNSWSWLPWNWGDGIGKSVQYGLYCITNFIWIISLYLSNATGYVIQQAYKLDFIDDMADSIGQGIQKLAGITRSGFSSNGFYVGFLLLLILAVGIYVAYAGLIKREINKAVHAVANFLVIFLLSSCFIAYAPNTIKMVNEFSSDISTAALDLGTGLIAPDSESEDSVSLIRDTLFSIQVRQPWLLLQFGSSNIEELGEDRVEALLSISPSLNDGKDRENAVKAEIEEQNNHNLTIPQVINRLGMVFFLLIFNLGITIFVFLLTGIMIFSQILFIIFSMFLPISLLLSMLPSYEHMARRGIEKVFNTIMLRAGITLVVTIAFSISSMLYDISGEYPFFMVAFLQIVTFAGIYFKLGDIMGMFSLHSSDSQSMGRHILHRPMMLMRHRIRKIERGIGKAVGSGTGSPVKAASTTRPASGENRAYQSPSQTAQTRGSTRSNEKFPTTMQEAQRKGSSSHSAVVPFPKKSSVSSKGTAPKGSYTSFPAYRDTTQTENLQKRSTLADRSIPKAPSAVESKKKGLHRPNIGERRRILTHDMEAIQVPTSHQMEQPSKPDIGRDKKQQENGKQRRSKRPLSADQTFSVPTDSEGMAPVRKKQEKNFQRAYHRPSDSYASLQDGSSPKRPVRSEFSMQKPDPVLPPTTPPVKSRPVAPSQKKVPRQKSKSKPKKRGRNKS